MDKSELFLKNFSILSKNPLKNSDALKSLIVQLCEENPQMALRCWREILINNVDEMEEYWGKSEYPYNSIGYLYVYDCLIDILGEENFKFIAEDFAKDKDMLDILYTKTVFATKEYSLQNTGFYLINYLLKHKKFQSADLILTAIYKNRAFSSYGTLWDNIISRFDHTETEYYSGGIWVGPYHKEDEDIQNFCLEWVERIPDEEQKAAAMTHIMRIF